MYTKITFVTGNKNKVDHLRRHLDIPVEIFSHDLPEIQSLDLEEIITHKAKQAFEIINSPVLVEDTALVFHALGKLPGPLIKFFLIDPMVGVSGLCQLLNNFKDRSATALVYFGLYDGIDMKFFKGERKGHISFLPRGNDQFGFNPIFIPEGWSKTWGEMTLEEQGQTSMRRLPLKELEKYLSLNQ